MLRKPISKKQKMNVITHALAFQWVLSVLPEDKVEELSAEDIFKALPTEPYFFSAGQTRINSFTLKWFKKRAKKVLNKSKHHKDIMSISLSEVLNA